MSWNYRVIYHPTKKRKLGDKEVDIEEYYAIHEVYYNEDGKESMYAIDPDIVGSSVEVLEDILNMMKMALEKKVLKISDFEPENA